MLNLSSYLVLALGVNAVTRSSLNSPYFAPSQPRDRVDFFVLGDWGATRGDYQKNVAGAMKKVFLSDPNCCDFLVSVGDNFYAEDNNVSPDGVNGAEDPKWNRTWKSVYGPLASRMPWFNVLGNHDWIGNAEAQVAYSKLDDNWNMPGFFYDHVIELKNPSTEGKGISKAAFVFVDTNLIYYGYDGAPVPGKEAPALKMQANFEALGWTAQNQTIENHLQQIEDLLEKHRDADYLFLTAHHSTGTCPSTSKTGGMERLAEIINKYKPTAVFYGHAHALQFSDNGNTFFVQSGAGSIQEPLCEGSTGWGMGGISGFVRSTLTSSLFNLEFINDANQVIQTAQKGPRNSPSPS